MLVAEGEVFELTRSVDALGLLGTVSAQVRWGDGTTSNAVVSTQPATGQLKVRFDYSLDTSGFFSGANSSRRALLQDAADAVLRSFNDDLKAIVPGGKKTWNAQFINPSTGQTTLNSDGTTNFAAARNLQVNANEIVVFVGARDLAGNERGRAGPGGFAFPTVTPSSQAELQQILAFRDDVQFRGETGASGNNPTDFGPWGGSIAFDNQGTDWYFGSDPNDIGSNQTDFVTVVMHEFLHVMGFGQAGINKSWDTFTSGSQFTGPKAKAAYNGSGNVPLEGAYHWGETILTQQNQATIMREELLRGKRQNPTDLDTAALDDIGWSRVNSRVTITAEHVYGDDGRYAAEIILKGSELGETVLSAATAVVTNVAPVLTVPANQSAVAGVPLSITDIGSISDKGFRQLNADPATTETFGYTINWGDGSNVHSGTATIDRHGNSSRTTLASLNGSHTYSTPGNYTVRVNVTDDNGGSDEETFRVTVVAPPKFELSLSKTSIVENANANAATLTIRRSGPALDTATVVNLSSSDTSEATLPSTVTIPANATSTTVAIDAVDDNLLDGSQTVSLRANAVGVDEGSVDLIVSDRETLRALLNLAKVREDATTGARLTLSRSNTNIDKSLTINVRGGNASELNFDAELVIPAQQQSVVVNLVPINDDDPEPTQTYTYTFTASGYVGDEAGIELIDDEPSFFQNQTEPLDVNGKEGVTALDALIVINQLTDRGGDTDLDPETETIYSNLYYDTNGDYKLTALDALLVINSLIETSPSKDSTAPEQLAATPIASIVDRTDDVKRRLIHEPFFAETQLF
ncbi:hypothetical protein Q31b_30450 [Novipirellula aureliae]|uniref:PKD domain-containing protein n=2 Tax=Novipirellula aureliae TaxID=2527966 RepID=A0A5C6DZF5_9BACT|nr:hypothetical protein Q31b_30450 [Novipirellula aureliae]